MKESTKEAIAWLLMCAACWMLGVLMGFVIGAGTFIKGWVP